MSTEKAACCAEGLTQDSSEDIERNYEKPWSEYKGMEDVRVSTKITFLRYVTPCTGVHM